MDELEEITIVLTKKEITVITATILVCHELLHERKPTMSALIHVVSSGKEAASIANKFSKALGV